MLRIISTTVAAPNGIAVDIAVNLVRDEIIIRGATTDGHLIMLNTQTAQAVKELLTLALMR